MTTFLTSGTVWSILLWGLLFIIATYFVTYYLVYLRQIKRWKQSNIPFLRPTSLIGHKYSVNAVKYSAAVPVDQIYKENTEKTLYGFFLGPVPMIMIKDQNLIRQVFVKNYRQIFSATVVLPESEVEAQHSIVFTVNEDRWKSIRTLMQPVFSSSWFQGSRFERINEAINELWLNARKVEIDGSPMNVSEVAENAALNIASSNFGIDAHSYAMKNGLRTVIKNFFGPSYRRIFSFWSFTVLPFLQMFESFKIMPLESCDIMSDILKHQINLRDQMNIETDDAVDIIRSFRTEQESMNSCNKGSDLLSMSEAVPTRQMTGIGLGLAIQGVDTVQGLVQFAIQSLSLYPEYQRKVREDVDAAMKEQGVSEFTFEVVRSLSFTYQCLFEVTRLYTPALLMRHCLKDFQIPGTNYILRRGDKIILPLYSLCHDEMHFRNPHSFDPQRFNNSKVKKDSNLAIPETLLSFGLGPRKCAGYAHGMFVAAALLASLLYKYEIKPHSHLKLIDATDLNPKALNASPRRDILVDLVRCEN